MSFWEPPALSPVLGLQASTTVPGFYNFIMRVELRTSCMCDAGPPLPQTSHFIFFFFLAFKQGCTEVLGSFRGQIDAQGKLTGHDFISMTILALTWIFPSRMRGLAALKAQAMRLSGRDLILHNVTWLSRQSFSLLGLWGKSWVTWAPISVLQSARSRNWRYVENECLLRALIKMAEAGFRET